MRIGTTTRKKPGNANPITLGIIFAIVGGAIFFLFALPPLQYSYASKAWPSVPGKIIKSEIGIWKSDGKTHYEPDIAYTYSVDGKSYSSSKITVGDPAIDNNITPAKRMQAEYPVDKEVDVYYDAELPASSALEPGIRTGDILLASIPAIFFFVGLLVLYQGFKARKVTKDANMYQHNQ